ncbi:MFS transporter [Jiangella alkaliphila]|uniref:Predicted arabinose efflux permease, MFS family n=1 Tax=Jiangella alkaliphila TaxID=419479 RepID=A0A1H2HGF1_9ACTN|nr:MFS transporter [Jiangella alkaliphila]SDU30852.1 Predicted arabinose efflux permease, MFS family [Jiangella alkaliphila]
MPARSSSPSLFSRDHLPLAIGAVALVTLGAFENRAVGTALPTLVREFDAVSSFGLATAAPIATYVVSLALAGLWADRSGPVPPLRAGAVTFAVAQVLVGTAAGMPQVIAGRLLSGLAEGLIDVGIMVLIARALPEALRPRMFSLFAAAWVLPSVVGPFLTGIVTEGVGWRWVFLGALAVLVPVWLLLRPALRTVPPSAGAAGAPVPGGASRSVLPWAFVAAASVFGLSLAGEHLSAETVPAVAIVVLGAAGTVLAAVRLLPRGTFRVRRGLPAVVAQRAFAGAAFGAVGSWLPLLLTLVHGFSPTTAGVSLSITGVTWAVGSWLQGRDHGRPPAVVLRAGLATMTAGLAVTTLLAWPAVPTVIGLLGWALAGLGMGLTSPVLSLLILAGSDRTNQGRNVSAGQLAGSLSTAAALAVSGAAVALTTPGPATFAGILVAGGVVALGGLLTAGRVVDDRTTAVEADVAPVG